ncbi:MAG: DUF4281 domain-containing protein [Anaerolineae bacterium]|nr:DUF4281 domain-containing protein [Anaerolineae bacterium]
MLDALFVLSLVVSAPFWLLLIVFPRREFTRSLFTTSYIYLCFIILGALYLFTLVGATTNAIATGEIGKWGLTSLGGLSAMFASPTVVLVVWIHLVTMDLAGGFMIYRAAQELNMRSLTLSIILFFTLLLGPLGILIFSLWRVLHGMRSRMVEE